MVKTNYKARAKKAWETRRANASKRGVKPGTKRGPYKKANRSRFRPTYRALTKKEKALHDAIKTKASELEELFSKVKPGRYNSLAITSLEQSIMWVVKELTS